MGLVGAEEAKDRLKRLRPDRQGVVRTSVRGSLQGNKGPIGSPGVATLEQEGDGTILLISRELEPLPASGFIGQIDSGVAVVLEGLHGPCLIGDGRIYYICSRGVIGSANDDGATELQLELTNVVVSNGNTEPNLVQTLDLRGHSFVIELSPTFDYALHVKSIQRNHIPRATAVARIPVDATSIEVDIVASLSLVQGNTVEAIRRLTIGSRKRVTATELRNKKVNKFTPSFFLAALSTDGTYLENSLRLDLADIQACAPKIGQFRLEYDPEMRLLNAWLDSRADADFLEARTLKQVIVLELLCALVEKRHTELGRFSTHVDPKAWKNCRNKGLETLRSFVTSALENTPKESIDGICDAGKWADLNRVSFRTKLTRDLAHLGIRLSNSESRLSILGKIRNNIVHQFRYLPITGQQGVVMTGTQQHYFCKALVEEVLLRLFGLGHRVDEWAARGTGPLEV